MVQQTLDLNAQLNPTSVSPSAGSTRSAATVPYGSSLTPTLSHGGERGKRPRRYIPLVTYEVGTRVPPRFTT